MKIYKKKCEICGRIIEGVSEKQVEYNMMIHTIKCKKQQAEKNNQKIKKGSRSSQSSK